MKALLPISAALLLALCLSASFHLDDHSGESAAADAAIAEQAEALRLAKAAKEMCGNNAAWTLIDSRTIQCLMHTGRKTVVAEVSP